MSWLFPVAVLVAVAAWAARRRLGGFGAGEELTDEQLRRIESTGRIEVEEPLDLREAAEEEERFWDESWDQPEPW